MSTSARLGIRAWATTGAVAATCVLGPSIAVASTQVHEAEMKSAATVE